MRTCTFFGDVLMLSVRQSDKGILHLTYSTNVRSVNIYRDIDQASGKICRRTSKRQRATYALLVRFIRGGGLLIGINRVLNNMGESDTNYRRFSRCEQLLHNKSWSTYMLGGKQLRVYNFSFTT